MLVCLVTPDWLGGCLDGCRRMSDLESNLERMVLLVARLVAKQRISAQQACHRIIASYKRKMVPPPPPAARQRGLGAD